MYALNRISCTVTHRSACAVDTCLGFLNRFLLFKQFFARGMLFKLVAIAVGVLAVAFSFWFVNEGGATLEQETTLASLYDTLIVEATSASGAHVPYFVGSGRLKCTLASGESVPAAATRLFPVGTTTITCLTDGPNVYLSVRVLNTHPTLICPPNLVLPTDEQSDEGATAVYALLASDVQDGNLTNQILCSIPSGSRFPVGTTAVNCDVYDSNGAQTMCGFTITVFRLVATSDNQVKP